uniref:Uncharacterized protein n=1 Tax=Lepeophtheirus salmonis TaxID=72036 RepID=A0A0K2UCQ1_LEPSM
MESSYTSIKTEEFLKEKYNQM